MQGDLEWGLRGWSINAFRSLGFGHVRGYTPVALLRKAAFLRATSQASTARQPPRGGFREKRDIWDFHGCPKYRVFCIVLGDVFLVLLCAVSDFLLG